jgi:UDP-N-acetylglucosamine diphosphorylase/glucosamine-1-phosphate N-acetyltransferase
MIICLFEDSRFVSLFPLTHLQAAFDLRCGVFSARERAQLLFPGSACGLLARQELADVLRERHACPVNEPPDGAALLLNGRALFTAESARIVAVDTESEVVFTAGDTIAACIVRPGGALHRALGGALREAPEPAAALIDALRAAAPGVAVRPIDIPCVEHAWDLIAHNEAMLHADAALFPMGTVHPGAVVHPGAWMLHGERVAVGDRARIGPGAVIDAGEGPVIIGDGADIMPLAVVQGPCAIGPGTRVKPGGRISASAIGPSCRIGGEVEGSIFHSTANKQHDGFVGHSYIASWTNLGADTNTSDLKNNYSAIRATVEGVEYGTGRRFLGTIMADHSKCGINTMFNTGTVVGVGCNIYGGDFPPKHVPSFSWGGSDGLTTHAFERFAETAAIVMQRRGRAFTDRERALCRGVFDRTASQRQGPTA